MDKRGKARWVGRAKVSLLGWIAWAMLGCQLPAGPRTGSASCSGLGEDHSCLALRIVSFADGAGRAVVDRTQAEANVSEINALWQACGIQFVLESYQQVAPVEVGLAYSPGQFVELDVIRGNFAAEGQVLIVATGPWAMGSPLRAYGANAWSTGPVASAPGTVVESSMAQFANLLAHELGHSLGLGHVNDARDVMNPVVYFQSTSLYADQCALARDSLTQFWGAALRG